MCIEAISSEEHHVGTLLALQCSKISFDGVVAIQLLKIYHHLFHI